MTFLNSLFLLALPLLAVPLVLHFLKRRERKVVKWGAMRFLHDATTDSRRMRLPESLLLLLTRCLLVAGLIFALARPLIHWGGSTAVADRELIVIVDDSLSTARRSDGEPVFEKIRSAATETINDSSTNLPVQIMLASGGGRWIGDQPQSVNTTAVKSAIAELAKQQPTLGSASLMSCIRKAISAANDRETSVRPRPAQRIVVVTDGMSPSWSDSDPISLGQLRSTIEQSNLPVKIQVVQIATDVNRFRNLSVVQIHSDSERVGTGKTVRLSAEIRNTGAIATPPCRLNWKINDKEVGHSGVPELEPGQTTEVFWSTRFKKVGPVAIVGQLQQSSKDDLPEDSVATRVVDVVKRIPILIVDNQSNTGSADLQSQPITLITSALGYEAEEASDEYHSIFSPTIVSADEVSGEDLTAYNAIVVLGTENETPELPDLLLSEVRRGCGVWLVLGSDPDKHLFNANWFQDGEGLSPLSLVDYPSDDAFSTEEADDGEKEELRIHPPSAQHPATRVLSDNQRIDLDQVTLQRHAWFQPLMLGDEVSIPLRSNRGTPLVIENSIGQGRVLVQSFPISLNATNWPVTNSFVVMVHEWLEYLAAPSARSLNLSVGMPLQWRFEDRNQRPSMLALPDGAKINLEEDARRYRVDRSVGEFNFMATRLPGTYRVRTSFRSEDQMEIPFHISPSRDELFSQPIEDQQREALEEAGQFELADSSSDLNTSADKFWSEQAKTSSIAGGQPIWHWIVIGLLGLLLAELLLAGRIGQLKGGVGNSSSDAIERMNQLGSPRRKNEMRKSKVKDVKEALVRKG
jgi:hypothetical protein